MRRLLIKHELKEREGLTSKALLRAFAQKYVQQN